MHVVCKSCEKEIAVEQKPQGTTGLQKARLHGPVNVDGGVITFGPGGGISLSAGGSISFGAPQPVEITCPHCGRVATYHDKDFVR